MKRVLYLINDLEKGGAETNLYQILKHSKKNDFLVTVVSLSGSGYYEKKILDLGINVILLDFKKRPLKSLFTIKHIIKNIDTISCWMYHSNLIGYLCWNHNKKVKIIWNIRHSNTDKSNDKKTTNLINKFCAKKSNKINLIVYNGKLAKQAHEKIGYSKSNSIVLANGCDLNEFNGISKNYLRKNYSIPQDVPIITSVGRNHKVKDPETFIRVLRELKNSSFDFIGMMCGFGYEKDNNLMINLCHKYNIIIDKDIFLLGQRDDINNILSESDFFVLHSLTEAFPNVLIQAMASKCVCISTNVGDASYILENDDFIVDIRDYKKIASIISKIWVNSIEVESIKNRNRERAVQLFNVHDIVKEYESIL